MGPISNVKSALHMFSHYRHLHYRLAMRFAQMGIGQMLLKLQGYVRNVRTTASHARPRAMTNARLAKRASSLIYQLGLRHLSNSLLALVKNVMTPVILAPDQNEWIAIQNNAMTMLSGLKKEPRPKPHPSSHLVI